MLILVHMIQITEHSVHIYFCPEALKTRESTKIKQAEVPQTKPKLTSDMLLNVKLFPYF